MKTSTEFLTFQYSPGLKCPSVLSTDVYYTLLCFVRLRPEHTKAVVLPELVELARDEGSTVRLAAFDTIINLLEMFDSGQLHRSFTSYQ